jgi:hypothetical protein
VGRLLCGVGSGVDFSHKFETQPKISLRGKRMIQRASGIASALLAAALVAGCNGEGSEGPVAAVPAAPFHATFAGLPPGAPCSEKITHYQSVLDADHSTGNVDPAVYDQISHEISQAAAACSAGHNGEALSLVHSSQARHGYHV